ncbi:MAG TPA: hypothetical protein VKB84_11845 [Candidatus Binataceae bacterium]|nr:hypothetical protein [Candidatus Binataceae bacterium]
MLFIATQACWVSQLTATAPEPAATTGVGVAVGVAVAVGVEVAVAVEVGLGVAVCVPVAVEDGSGVGVDVSMGVGVAVAADVEVAVGVGVRTTTMADELLPLHPASTTEASRANEQAITSRPPIKVWSVVRGSGCGHRRDELVVAGFLISPSICRLRADSQARVPPGQRILKMVKNCCRFHLGPMQNIGLEPAGY